MQLRELALLNGTLRELDGPRCNNCGAATHKSWECPDKPNVTHQIICSACGGSGHIARDCRQRSMGMGPPGDSDPSKIDEEYSALMAELGEAPPKGSSGSGLHIRVIDSDFKFSIRRGHLSRIIGD
jgi:splicing factor 1